MALIWADSWNEPDPKTPRQNPAKDAPLPYSTRLEKLSARLDFLFEKMQQIEQNTLSMNDEIRCMHHQLIMLMEHLNVPMPPRIALAGHVSDVRT